jgi:hypothetical protein
MLSDPDLVLRRGRQKRAVKAEQVSLLLLPHIARERPGRPEARRAKSARTLRLFEETAPLAG